MNALSALFAPFAIMTTFMAILVALGDPLVFLLQKISPAWVPVDRPGFVNLQVIVFVLDESSA